MELKGFDMDGQVDKEAKLEKQDGDQKLQIKSEFVTKR